MQELNSRQLNQLHRRGNATEAVHGARAGEYIRDVVFSAPTSSALSSASGRILEWELLPKVIPD